ncbi:MAG: YggT family protein [Candidatus Cloacimonetes bacterium]|nr:YggT family protein [Candidatus Cloacimonadota bacterium]
MGLLITLLNAYEILIILRAVFSWIAPNPNNSFYHFLVQVTEPVLSQIRRILPQKSGIDFSPLVALLLIHLVKSLLVKSP